MTYFLIEASPAYNCARRWPPRSAVASLKKRVNTTTAANGQGSRVDNHANPTKDDQTGRHSDGNIPRVVAARAPVDGWLSVSC